MTERFCEACNASLGLMTDEQYDEWNAAHDGVCDACWEDLDANVVEYCCEREDNFRDDVEADADVLRMAGMGTDEDYGYYGGDEDYYGSDE